ncbi:MAG TPA: tetratricopeptide repeat protein [Blastocatellia bacterium]|nr:tetratricopeptide repeat protein [Blastocatellia bacterium]
MRLFKAGRYAEAADAFNAVVVTEPQSAEALLYLSKSLINVERFQAAEAALRRYIALPAITADGAYLLAYVLFRQGRAADSLGVYQTAVLRQPPVADDLKIIGLNYGLLKDYERAAEWLQKALALDTNNLEARYYLGRVRYTQNRFAEACREFQAVLTRDPNHVKAQNNLGQALEGMNDIEGARAAYQRAIELDRHNSKPSEMPLLNLAIFHLQRDEVDAALPLLTRAASLNPASAQVRFQLGKLYLRQSRWNEAEKELRAATQLAPDDKGAHYQLGRLYHRLGKTELARQELAISEQLAAKERP